MYRWFFMFPKGWKGDRTAFCAFLSLYLLNDTRLSDMRYDERLEAGSWFPFFSRALL